MVDGMAGAQKSRSGASAMDRWRHVAWLFILIADAGLLAWGAMAAVLPDYLLGPGGKQILPAGYEGFTGSSWSEFVSTSPMAARYIEVLF